MADSKITALTALTAADPANDMIPIVDVSDTPPASGNTKRISINNILACSPSATLASATISGDLTVRTTGLVVGSTATGIGITPNTWSGAWKAAQVGRLTLGNATTDSLIGHNFYNDGSYRFAANDFASYYDQVGGAHVWGSSVTSGTAGNAIGWTVLATLNATGLGVGASPSYKLSVAGTANIGTIGTAGRSLLIASSAADNITIEQTNNGSGSHTFDIKTPGWSTDSFNVYSGSTNRLKLTGDGNLGIGVTPSAWVTFKAIQHPALSLASYSTTEAYYSQNAYNDGIWRRVAAGYASQYIQVNSEHRFLTAGTSSAGSSITFTQAMTLDASGILMVGTTNSVIWNTTNTGCVVSGNAFQASRSDDVSLLLNRLGSNGKIALFARQGGEVGDISVTTTGTTFNSTSDYRLKEAVAPLSGGLARVNALKPSIYNWKSNGSTGEGFLAHELAEVVPAAVTGEKDAVNEDGSIKAQSIDMSRVVPILVAAIQELTAEVNALKKA